MEETDGLTKFHVLSDQDHLLRRFGQVQVIRKSPGRSETLCLREVADEVWALIEGQVEFTWYDLRQDSEKCELFQTRIESSTIDDLFHAFRSNPNIPSKDTSINKLKGKLKAKMELKLEL